MESGLLSVKLAPSIVAGLAPVFVMRTITLCISAGCCNEKESIALLSVPNNFQKLSRIESTLPLNAAIPLTTATNVAIGRHHLVQRDMVVSVISARLRRSKQT